MKVKVRNTNSDAGSVKTSECFWYKGLLYMRVATDALIKQEPDIVYAVLLTTGMIFKFDANIQVETVDCSVVSSLEVPVERGKWEV